MPSVMAGKALASSSVSQIGSFFVFGIEIVKAAENHAGLVLAGIVLLVGSGHHQ